MSDYRKIMAQWKDWRIEEGNQELNEDSYHVNQLNNAEKNHDWAYKMRVKFFGEKNSSNFLNISKNTFEAIKKILKKEK